MGEKKIKMCQKKTSLFKKCLRIQGENEKRMNEIVAELSKNPMAIRLLKEID